MFKVLQQSWRSFTSLKLWKCSQNPYPASQHQIPIKTICLIICQHSKHSKICHHTRCCVGLRGMISRNKEWNSSTRQIRLTLMNNSWTITLKSQMVRCSDEMIRSSGALGFYVVYIWVSTSGQKHHPPPSCQAPLKL